MRGRVVTVRSKPEPAVMVAAVAQALTLRDEQLSQLASEVATELEKRVGPLLEQAKTIGKAEGLILGHEKAMQHVRVLHQMKDNGSRWVGYLGELARTVAMKGVIYVVNVIRRRRQD